MIPSSIALLAALAAAAPARPIEMSEVVQRVLERGHVVEVARLDVGYWGASAEAEREPFVPALTVGVSYRNSVDPNFNLYYDWSRDSVRNDTAAAYLGLVGKLSLGTEYQLKAGLQRMSTDQLAAPLSPSWSSPLELTLSQPLLKGRGLFNERALRMALAQHEQASATLDRVGTDALLAAAESYINLQAAQARLQARKELRQLGASIFKVTGELIRAGRLPASAEIPESVVLSLRDQDVLAAEVDLDQAQSALASALDAHEQVAFVAAQPLEANPADEALLVHAGESAVAANPEVLAKQRELELHRLEVAIRENQALPDLRLRASAGAIGQSGNSRCLYGYGVDGATPCAVPPSLDGGPDLAAANTFKARFGYYEAGLVFSWPLDREPSRRSVEAGRIALRKAERELDMMKMHARHRAETGARTIGALLGALKETQRAVDLATQGVTFAKESYAMGRGTVFDLIKAEDLLAQTRDREVSMRHRIAIEQVRLQAVTGQLLGALSGKKAVAVSTPE